MKTIQEECWSGYKQIGMKKKGERMVPNCVPIEEKTLCKPCALKFAEGLRTAPILEAEYQGRTVKLNKPIKGDSKKFEVYVTNDKGNVVKVNFGDPNMRIKAGNIERRKSFRARHKCDQKKDKTSAGYWSCRMWSSKPVSSILKGK